MSTLHGIEQVFGHSFRLGMKDLLVFIRDRPRLVSFIIMPIFMMVMVGFVFPSENTLKNAPLAIVDLDQGPLGKQIGEFLSQPNPKDNKKLFEITHLGSEGEAVEEIKKQEINGAVVIPSNFSSTLMSGHQAEITIIMDQSNPQISMIIDSVLQRFMSEISTGLAVKSIATKLPGTSDPEAVVRPFVVRTEGVVPGKPNYFEFMAPGIMAMVIMMATMTGLASSISREREIGTMDGILAAPISRLSIVVGKSLAQTVRGIAQALITLALAVVLFGVTVHGSWWLLGLLLVLAVVSFIGLGIMISAMASSQETASMVMMTFTFPMIFLSGAFFPIQQMPVALQWVSKAIPLTYSVEALRKCIVLGTGVSGMMTEIWVMLAFGVLFTILSIPIFSRVITR